MRLPVVLAATALLATSASAQAPASATAELKNSQGQTVGAVLLTAAPNGVLMKVEAKGLSAGWHGLHFHEKADCSKSDFTSAGAHVHGPETAVHGLLNPAANDLGDLPNIHAGADGAAATEVFTTLVTLEKLKDADGSAVVIHANPDDHMAQPIGGAGPRVACAEIR
ncbi:superoxide dismutase family protein [Phenylobacterium sp.]|uniref:superoxide dismutase family protein n=1 Tax=Phenylobacterium sp. TaxID=1871053 RepID=UPI0025D827C6|nr:superoxide dismutase family protein [Phenylobacterium sp.]MBX3483277.1 superoxide dismutase family protein [Phenylobacterium sp.]MCW5759473.1 superoxide dismutase family protein [Phenylobacterium sp.]